MKLRTLRGVSLLTLICLPHRWRKYWCLGCLVWWLNPVSKNGDTSKWLVSCDPIDTVLLAELIKVWLISEYIENSYINPVARNAVQNKAKDLYKLIDSQHLIYNEPIELKMFDGDGKAACGETFRVLGLEIVNRLVGKELLLGDRKVRLLYSGKNELTTDPVELYTGKKKQYFSIVIKFSVQTTPPERKAFIIYNLSVRRWVSVPSKAWNYKKSNTKAYIRINDNTLQVMEALIEKISCYSGMRLIRNVLIFIK